MKLSTLLSWNSIFLTTLLVSPQAWTAACCGGGFAAPALIVGDDKAQITSSFGFTDVVVDNVDTQGLWRAREEHQKVQTLRFEAATLISDRWQAGIALPVIQRSYAGQTAAGIGDIATTWGYEYLPDWNYHPYRPKGLGYMQLTLPTGQSRAESENGMDSRGQGFWALGLGTLLTKSWMKWDVFFSFEAHRSFEKEFENSNMKGTLKPGYGSTFGAGVGYNTAAWRWGGSVLWSYEDAVTIEPAGWSEGSVERYATASLSASYLPNDEWTGTVTYVDQTIFGEPVNTSLGRGLTVQMQRRWGR